MLGDNHISFTTSKIGSLVDVQECKDPDSLRCFYYLVQVSANVLDIPHTSCRSYVTGSIRGWSRSHLTYSPGGCCLEDFAASVNCCSVK